MPPPKPFIVEAEGAILGAVAFTGWDEGMAVASGTFRPTGEYRPLEHATELDGVTLNRTKTLLLTWADGRPLRCATVTLVDWSSKAGDDGREIVAFGIEDEAFRGAP